MSDVLLERISNRQRDDLADKIFAPKPLSVSTEKPALTLDMAEPEQKPALTLDMAEPKAPPPLTLDMAEPEQKPALTLDMAEPRDIRQFMDRGEQMPPAPQASGRPGEAMAPPQPPEISQPLPTPSPGPPPEASPVEIFTPKTTKEKLSAIGAMPDAYEGYGDFWPGFWSSTMAEVLNIGKDWKNIGTKRRAMEAEFKARKKIAFGGLEDFKAVYDFGKATGQLPRIMSMVRKFRNNPDMTFDSYREELENDMGFPTYGHDKDFTPLILSEDAFGEIVDIAYTNSSKWDDPRDGGISGFLGSLFGFAVKAGLFRKVIGKLALPGGKNMVGFGMADAQRSVSHGGPGIEAFQKGANIAGAGEVGGLLAMAGMAGAQMPSGTSWKDRMEEAFKFYLIGKGLSPIRTAGQTAGLGAKIAGAIKQATEGVPKRGQLPVLPEPVGTSLGPRSPSAGGPREPTRGEPVPEPAKPFSSKLPPSRPGPYDSISESTTKRTESGPYDYDLEPARSGPVPSPSKRVSGPKISEVGEQPIEIPEGLAPEWARSVPPELKRGEKVKPAPDTSWTERQLKRMGKTEIARSTRKVFLYALGKIKRAEFEASTFSRAARRNLSVKDMARDTKGRRIKGTSIRDDMYFYAEKTRNPRIEGDTWEALKIRVEANPHSKYFAQKYRKAFDERRDQYNELMDTINDNSWISYLENYVARYWEMPPKGAAEFVAKWRKNNPHEKKRRFPTTEEGMELGYKPVSTDITYSYQRYASDLAWSGHTREFLNLIDNIKLPQDQKIAYYKPPGSGRGSAPVNYRKVESDLLSKYNSKRRADGTLELRESSAYVHPEAYRAYMLMLDKPFTHWGPKMISAINHNAKAIELSFSMFHEAALGESSQAVLFKFLNPVRGIFLGPFEGKRRFPEEPYKVRLTYRAGLKLMENNPVIADGVQNGLELGRSMGNDFARSNMDKIFAGIEKIGGGKVDVVARIPRIIQENYNRHLWDNVHVGLKAFSYASEVARIMPRLKPGKDPNHLKRIVATYINEAFGGLGLERSFTTKEREIMYWGLYAPDWTLSNFLVGTGMFRAIAKRDLPMFRLYFRYARNMAITQFLQLTAQQVAIHAAFGKDDTDLKKYPWQGPPGQVFSLDVTPIYRKMLSGMEAAGLVDLDPEESARRYTIKTTKQVREFIRYFEDPLALEGVRMGVERKLAVVPRLVLESVFNHRVGSKFPLPWMETPYRRGMKGWKLGFERFPKHIAKSFIPFSFQGSSFAFTFPMSKGYSKTKARDHYKYAMQWQIMPGYANKAWYAITGLDRQKAMAGLIRDIDQALRANGASVEDRLQVFKDARSDVLTYHFMDMVDAIDKQKMEKAREHASAMVRLGVLNRELRSRQKSGLESGKISQEVSDQLWDALGTNVGDPDFYVPFPELDDK